MFETSDIYIFLTGEEDTVPEFQYNWTTVPRLQPLDPAKVPTLPANAAPPAAPAAPAQRPASPPSPDSSHKTCHKQPTLIANTTNLRYQAKINTAFQNSALTARPFRGFNLRHLSTASSYKGTQPETALQGQLQGFQYQLFTIRAC
jgi:hypothetical protein